MAVGGSLPHAGTFLVVRDDFAHAELAIVLSGDPVSRTRTAARLYQEDRVDALLVIPEPRSLSEGKLVRLGLFDPTAPPISRRILAASGVPASGITQYSEAIDGTIVEAMRLHGVFAGRYPRHLSIITATVATRRARMIFRRVFRETRATIDSSPSACDRVSPDRWWQRPRDTLSVVMESQQLIVSALTLGLGLQDRLWGGE